MEKQTIIIIPAYNEEKNIAAVINKTKSMALDADILIINDNSQDQTREIASRLGVRVINLPYHMGYGAALQTGFKYALKNGYQYAVQIDGDGQHEPSDIPKLLRVVLHGEADVVIGSRFLDGGRYQAPLTRKIGMTVFSQVVSLIIGQKITDPTSGYQAMNIRGLRFYASDFYPADYPDADVIIMLHRAGLKIKETSVTMYPNLQQKSMHAGIEPLYYVFKMFLSIFLTLVRKKSFPQI